MVSSAACCQVAGILPAVCNDAELLLAAGLAADSFVAFPISVMAIMGMQAASAAFWPPLFRASAMAAVLDRGGSSELSMWPAGKSLPPAVVRMGFDYSIQHGVPLAGFLGDECITLKMTPELEVSSVASLWAHLLKFDMSLLPTLRPHRSQ